MTEQKGKFPGTFFLVAFMLAPFLFLYMAVHLDDQRETVVQPDLLPTLRTILIAFAVLALLCPFSFKRKLMAAFRAKPIGFGATAEQAMFLIGLSYSFMPVILGFILFYLGTPIQELFYFAGASLVAFTVWGVHWKSSVLGLNK